METPASMPLKASGKLRLMCSYGGNIIPRPHMKSLFYAGGDTRIIAIPSAAALTLASLVNHLAVALGVAYPFTIKYQLPHHDLDSLISIASDEDLQIMLEDHVRLSSALTSSPPSQSRIRLFLFPTKPHQTQTGATQPDQGRQKVAAAEMDWFGIGETEVVRSELTQPVLQHPKTETWFVDALRSAKIMQSEGSNGGDGGGGICGQDSILLETNSSFGSTSSSASLTNLPPIKRHGEDNIPNLQDNRIKFAPPESVPSDNGMAAPISYVQTGPSHELNPNFPVFENKVSSNPSETEAGILNPSFVHQMNKPVLVPGYPHLSSPANQPQQQQVQVIYPGTHYATQNPPGGIPFSPYYPVYHPLPQQTPQPYMFYYVPVGQTHQPYNFPMQTNLIRNLGISSSQPPMNSDTASNSSQVDSEEVRATNPLLVQVPYDDQPQIHHQPQTTGVSHRETVNNNKDLEDDAARAQIYKSQPPPPMVPSQYQTIMLSEAFAQLRTDNT